MIALRIHSLSLKRRLARLAMMAGFVGVLFYGLVVWWCAKEIAEPDRRAVSASSRAFFDGSAKAGFTVEKFVSSDGMPCLVCLPERVEELSKRAGTIRGQLAEMGVRVKAPGEVVGTLLILHGRSGIKEDYLAVAERFCAVGFRCVIPDLPGHGGNPEPFTTYGVLEAPMILKCYAEAAEKFGFSQQPCGILGQSMGGAEAVHTLVLDGAPFAAMILVASFDRLETAIHAQANLLLGFTLGVAVSKPAEMLYGWRTGVRVSEIDSSQKARKIRIPALVVHGDADTMVPTASGKALFDSIPSGTEKRWLEIPGAGHNNVLVTDFPPYATMAEWFLDHLTDGSR